MNISFEEKIKRFNSLPKLKFDKSADIKNIISLIVRFNIDKKEIDTLNKIRLHHKTYNLTITFDCELGAIHIDLLHRKKYGNYSKEIDGYFHRFDVDNTAFNGLSKLIKEYKK